MTVEEAYSKFKKEHSDLVILSCYEYDSCFAFHAVPSDHVSNDQTNMLFDSVFSINKEDGSLSFFNPLDISEEEYSNGTKLPIGLFDVKTSKLPKYDRDAVIKWINSATH